MNATAVPSAAPSVPSVSAGPALWSFGNALLFVIILVLFFLSLAIGSRAVMDIKAIKADWANQRCTPLVMPFASWFGVDAKANFDFCMGKTFTGHSQPFMGSVTSIFGTFTVLLQRIFQSVNAMRNTVATLGGGVNVIFQEFAERISMFFFRLRTTGIYMRSLFMRMYALLFSVMYMGMSGVTGMTSFTNTYLFSFIDTFCFPGDTTVRVQCDGEPKDVCIRDVRIGDRLYPSGDRVTACFEFDAVGQPMVRLGSVTVSTNHYVYHKGKRVRADAHPDARPLSPWGTEPLYCLNTDTHHIPIGGYVFMDYDETAEADEEAMRRVEACVNGGLYRASCPHTSLLQGGMRGAGCPIQPPRALKDSMGSMDSAGMALAPSTRIRLATGECKAATELRRGDRLSTGSTIAGVIQKLVIDTVVVDGVEMTPTTLYWAPEESQWKRTGTQAAEVTAETAPKIFLSFIAAPNSQIELESGLRIRDYLEWCSPDAEAPYRTAMIGGQ